MVQTHLEQKIKDSHLKAGNRFGAPSKEKHKEKQLHCQKQLRELDHERPMCERQSERKRQSNCPKHLRERRFAKGTPTLIGKRPSGQVNGKEVVKEKFM